MRIVTENFEILAKTTATVFEGLDFSEIFDIAEKMTKISRIGVRPFRRVNHSLQMKHSVYDMAYESVHYIIERVFKDMEDGETYITLFEHTDGGSVPAETIEWTFSLEEVLTDIVGIHPADL